MFTGWNLRQRERIQDVVFSVMENRTQNTGSRTMNRAVVRGMRSTGAMANLDRAPVNLGCLFRVFRGYTRSDWLAALTHRLDGRVPGLSKSWCSTREPDEWTFYQLHKPMEPPQ